MMRVCSKAVKSKDKDGAVREFRKLSAPDVTAGDDSSGDEAVLSSVCGPRVKSTKAKKQGDDDEQEEDSATGTADAAEDVVRPAQRTTPKKTAPSGGPAAPNSGSTRP